MGGCAAYVSDEQVNTLFITKGKICPIKNLEFTIARKKMVGILMACRLTDFIVDACAKYFEFESIHLWSDSQVCLSWLTSKNILESLTINEYSQTQNIWHKHPM